MPPPPLASSRYNRQLLLPQISLPGQDTLLSSRVLIIGLGGLGSPAALYLAGAGIGTLGFADADLVETSNLHRQIVHSETSVENRMTKVQSAIKGCQNLNSSIRYVAHEDRLSVSNALDIIRDYDLVLDCTDNPATRYLISDACVVLNKTLVSGAAQRLEGQMVVLNYPTTTTDKQGVKTPTRGPCYRCVFPRPPDPEMVRGCNEIGILGPVVGCIGTLMASEAIRLIVQGGITTSNLHATESPMTTKEPSERKPTLLLYTAWPTPPSPPFRSITLAGRRKNCLACGDEESLHKQGKTKITRAVLEQGSMDYEAFCGRVEDISVLRPENRIAPGQLLGRLETNTNPLSTDAGSGKGMTIIDVREENEFILGAKIKGSSEYSYHEDLKGSSGCAGESTPQIAMNARTRMIRRWTMLPNHRYISSVIEETILNLRRRR